jgi:PA14 domain/Gametolysin peptidase M11
MIMKLLYGFLSLLFVFCISFSIGYSKSVFADVAWEASGTLEVLVADYFDEDVSRTNYYLHVQDGSLKGNKIEILFSQTLSASLLTGDKISVSGNWVRQNNSSKLKVNDWFVEQAAPIRTRGLQTRKAIYLRINFSDLNATFSENQIVDKMLMNQDWYKQASYGQLDFPTDVDSDGKPDVFSIVIPHTKAEGCDAGAIQSKAVAAANAAGINMALYQHRVLILPPSNCGWAGLGNVGCANSCTSWIASPEWDLVYTHELGHNLGMHHSGTDTNDDGALESEYGDGSCPMGNIIDKGFFNAPHTFQMQWLTEAGENVKTVSASGEYILYAPGQNLTSLSPQIIRIKRNADSFYYLSYRPNTEFDMLPREFGNGVSIYRYSAGATQTGLIRTLSNGESWENGLIQVRQIEKTETYTKISIQQECFKPIEIAMTPSYSSIYPDNPAVFSLQFTNTNEAVCEAINLRLNANLPTGFLANWEADNINVSPGETKTIAMELRTTLLEGSYDISVNALNTKNNQILSETSRVYIQKTPVQFLPGLMLKHYKGQWNILPDFSTLTPDEEKITDIISLAGYSGDAFGLVFDGFIKINDAGNYTFTLNSDDGSKMFLRSALLINNDGLHSSKRKAASKFLQAGLYPIKIDFFESGGGEELQLMWKKDGDPEVAVPASAFFYRNENRPNLPPTVDAGPDENIVKTKQHTMTGTATDPDGSIASLEWQQISGPALTLSNINSLTLTLKNLKVGEFVFRLTAIDNEGASSFDERKLTIVAPNKQPLVYAGDDVTVRLGETVLLHGTAEDKDGTIIAAGWRFLSGKNVASSSLAPMSIVNLTYSFTAAELGKTTYQFFATDNQKATRSDQVIVTVIP